MPLTCDQASALIRASHGRAQELGLRVTVAVVDEGGALQALGRMDGAAPLSAQIAEAKAAGAAAWHREGDRLAELKANRTALFESVDRLTRLPLIPAAGSLLLHQGESVIGAVGVSGARSEEDLDCARAGVRAVLGDAS